MAQITARTITVPDWTTIRAMAPQHALPVDGNWGPKTAWMFEYVVCARFAPGDAEAGLTSSLHTDTVYALQTHLNACNAKFRLGVPDLPTDGRFGARTEDALKRYVCQVGRIGNIDGQPVDKMRLPVSLVQHWLNAAWSHTLMPNSYTGRGRPVVVPYHV